MKIKYDEFDIEIDENGKITSDIPEDELSKRVWEVVQKQIEDKLSVKIAYVDAIYSMYKDSVNHHVQIDKELKEKVDQLNKLVKGE